MDHFEYIEDELYCDEVPARDLVAQYGTPLYVYCQRTLDHHYESLKSAFARLEPQPLICYSVKANSNLTLLKRLNQLGSGFDIVSGGELARTQTIGADPKRIVYAGVGKTEPEITAGILAGILLFNIESQSELERVESIARKLDREVDVAVRVNPDVDPETHRYITTGKYENKFGLDLASARAIFERRDELKRVRLAGLHAHIGSQITSTEPYAQSVSRVLEFRDELGSLGRDLEWLDLGGGFGVHYREDEALPAASFAEVLIPLIESSGLKLILEPGRFIMANAGCLLTTVIALKETGDRLFAICDAGMNDLIRPSLYEAYHRIEPVVRRDTVGSRGALVDVVGPICESGDFLGKERPLAGICEGEILSVFSAGAYAASMASNYNTRPRAAEVLVDGREVKIVRERESLDDLLRSERASL